MTKYEHTAGVLGPFVKVADVQAMLGDMLNWLSHDDVYREILVDKIKDEGFEVKDNE